MSQRGGIRAEANIEEQRTLACSNQIRNAGITSKTVTGLLVDQDSQVKELQGGKVKRLGLVDAFPVGLLGPIPVPLEGPIAPKHLWHENR
jgi:hypothetical protein